MSITRSVAQAVAQAAADLNEAFELADEDLPRRSNVIPIRGHRIGTPTPTTLAECVPLLTITHEFLKRGPEEISIEGIERYRLKAMQLLAHVQPVIERRAQLTIDDWAAEMLERPDITHTLV